MSPGNLTGGRTRGQPACTGRARLPVGGGRARPLHSTRGRPSAGGAGRSVVASASALGAEDRRFESCRPDSVHHPAGVAQWQSSSLPSWSCEFDSRHPLDKTSPFAASLALVWSLRTGRCPGSGYEHPICCCVRRPKPTCRPSWPRCGQTSPATRSCLGSRGWTRARIARYPPVSPTGSRWVTGQSTAGGSTSSSWSASGSSACSRWKVRTSRFCVLSTVLPTSLETSGDAVGGSRLGALCWRSPSAL